MKFTTGENVIGTIFYIPQVACANMKKIRAGIVLKHIYVMCRRLGV